MTELLPRERQSTCSGKIPLAHAQIICLPLRTQDVSAILWRRMWGRLPTMPRCHLWSKMWWEREGIRGEYKGCQIVADAIDFLKSYRELDSEKVVSLPIESKNYNIVKRQFKNIRLFGRQNTNLTIRSGPSQPWYPTRFLFGQAPSRPFLGQGGPNGQRPSHLGFNNQRLNIGARPMNKMPPRKNLRG